MHELVFSFVGSGYSRFGLVPSVLPDERNPVVAFQRRQIVYVPQLVNVGSEEIPLFGIKQVALARFLRFQWNPRDCGVFLFCVLRWCFHDRSKISFTQLRLWNDSIPKLLLDLRVRHDSYRVEF